jgi:hypothetical protein
MGRRTPPTYKTKNWPAHNEVLRPRGSPFDLVRSRHGREASPTGKRGQQGDYSDTAIQTCLTIKVLFGMALRQTTGFVESLVRLIGLDWTVPNFSTLSHRQRTLKVNIPYRGTNSPLHLLADSTGIKAEGEGEWNARKHGGAKRRVRHGRSDQWRDMAHGARSTSGSMKRRWKSGRPSASQATSAMRPCCLNCSTRPPARETASVTADGAFDTRKCHEAIAARGAAAIMPPRKNAKPWKPGTAGAIASNDILRTSTRFGRTIRERWSEYHRGLQEACGGSRPP